MTTTKRSDRLRRVGVLAAAGLLTAALGPAASAARHHAPRSAGRKTPSGRQEYALAGIRIGDSYRTVLSRFGNPTETQLERITLVAGAGGAAGAANIPQKIFVGPGASGATGAPGAGQGGQGAGGGFPGGGGPPPGLGGSLAGAIGGLGGGALFQMGRSSLLSGAGGGAPGGGGGFPGGGGGFPGGGGGFPGGGPPGGFPGGGGPGAGGPGAGTVITPDHPEYRWIYDEPSASSLEFTFSPDGRVVQIRATGYRGVAKTLRGITLGMKYSQVIQAYGNPEIQNYDGSVLTTDYTNSAHVSFQFYNQRLVGITVAQVD